MRSHRLSRLALLTQGAALIGLGLSELACSKDPPPVSPEKEPVHLNAPPPKHVNAPPEDPTPDTASTPPSQLSASASSTAPPAAPSASAAPSAAPGKLPKPNPEHVNSPAHTAPPKKP